MNINFFSRFIIIIISLFIVCPSRLKYDAPAILHRFRSFSDQFPSENVYYYYYYAAFARNIIHELNMMRSKYVEEKGATTVRIQTTCGIHNMDIGRSGAKWSDDDDTHTHTPMLEKFSRFT